MRVKKCIIVALLLCMICQLAACQKTELEESCFPLLVAVDYEDDTNKMSFCAGFPRAENSGGSTGQSTELQVSRAYGTTFEESKEAYENKLNTTPDYNHLKVLVLEDDLAWNNEKLDEVLDALARTEEFPRNTYVCIVDDEDELFELDKKLSQDIGTYLEEYLGSRNKDGDKMLTLGDLLDEKENQEIVLYAPFLEVEDTYVQWGGYYCIGSGMPPVNFQ